MARHGGLSAIVHAPSAVWTAPPGKPWHGVVRIAGAFLLGSAIISLASAGREMEGPDVGGSAALAALGGLLLAATARSPWLRRPALGVLLILSAIVLLIATVLLAKLLFVLVAHGLGFSWSWGSDDSDSEPESVDSGTDGEAETNDQRSGGWPRRWLNWLPGLDLGTTTTANDTRKSCPGCGRAAGTGTGGLCRSCSW